MKKSLHLLFALLLTHYGWSQTLKPIAARVLQEKQTRGDFPQSGLFGAKVLNVNDRPDLQQDLAGGLLLSWDEGQVSALRSSNLEQVEFSLPIPGNEVLQLDLVRGNVFSPEFTVRQSTNPDAVAQVDHGLHYWGIVKDRPGTLVGISIFENEIMGIISTETEKFILGALHNDVAKTHIIYREKDLKKQNEHACWTDILEDVRKEPAAGDRSLGPDNCVRMYMEADYTIFQTTGSLANATAYITGFFSQVSLLYANESVNMVLNQLLVWTTVDPYTGPSSSNYLTQFRNALNGNYNGDLAHLVGFTGGGGIAYVDVLCNSYYGVGYSGINTTYSNVPTYSWTVEVVTHEIGHNLGSSHTHACVWNGNNTAIDGCGPTAGYSEGCTGPLPTAGTIMSYCHLVSGVGINFNLGFGPQPGDRIRTEVYNAACLTTCGGGGPCTYSTINTNNFESGFGIWTDGGTDCARINNATYANSPTYSIQLRDNTSTSVMSTTSQNWASYEELTVAFSYITVSFDNSNEDFWVQLSTNGGSTYTTVGDFNYGAQFTNGVRGSASVVIPGPFTSTTRLRIRCDASADDDQVYIDDVVISGCAPSIAPDGTPVEVRLDGSTENVFPTIAGFAVRPNPANDQLTIDFDIDMDGTVEVLLNDLTGRSLLQNQYNVAAGSHQTRLDLNSVPNGIYLVHLIGNDQTYTQKIMVVRQ